MANKFRALQIGGIDLETQFQILTDVDWDYLDPSLFYVESGYLEAIENVLREIGDFDLVYVQAAYSAELLDVLRLVSTPYNTYVDKQFWDEQYKNDALIQERFVRSLNYRSEEERFEKLRAVTYSGQYGDKISPKYAQVNPNFCGFSQYKGNYVLTLKGDFGERLKPIATFRNNLVYDKDKVIQVWPQYTIEGDVEVEYTFRVMQGGYTDKIIEEIVMTQTELEHPLELPQKSFESYISVSVKAKGQGTINLGAIHKRWSRLDMGLFILGGERYVDEHREEFMYYLDPGDLKPPLNVYFSGYRSAEGFEGYFMMKKLNAPFLLITDPRIEGGSFYIGSDSYEQGIKNVIQQSLQKLGFEENDLILSGLSMGSFGALYYGAQLNPQSVIVGKPLINIGAIANNMQLLRPQEFGTALDVLIANEKGIGPQNITSLNNKFWNVMNRANTSNTTFAIAYMEHDDYDPKAFDEILPLLTERQARVMSRGVPGRHNDDSPTITNWFVNFYHIILESQFGRVKHDNK
jgi:accessory secretory protein Asp2